MLTSAGVSAGIDLPLTLLSLSHSPAVAQTVQLTLEYDPQPPYDAGIPAKAPADIGQLVSCCTDRGAPDVSHPEHSHRDARIASG